MKDIVDYEMYLNQSQRLLKHYIDICDYKTAFYTLINVLSNFPLFKKFTDSLIEHSK
jgi:hypothetical protein